MAQRINLTDEYQTRDGRAVELWKVEDGRVFGRVKKLECREWVSCDWDTDGNQYDDGYSNSDLIPKPKRHKRTVWVAWRVDDDDPRSFKSESDVRCYVANFPQHKWAGITGPHEIEFTEGEGLPASGLAAEGAG